MAEESGVKPNQDQLLGIKILLVEDDPLLLEVTSKELATRGAEVKNIADGAQAVTEAVVFNPSVVLLDLMLPGMNGEDVLAGLKAHPTLKSVPVIIFSNRSEESDIAKLKDLGAVEYFVKISTNFDTLAKAIQEHTKKGGA